MTDRTGTESPRGGDARSSGVPPNGVGTRLEHGIDPDDERLADLLSLGYSHAKVSEETGVSTKTIQRRLRNPDFKAKVNERKRDLHAESMRQLLGLRDKAVEVFAASLDSDQERFRIQAARTIYDLIGRMSREQVAELTARVDSLEAELSRRTTGEPE